MVSEGFPAETDDLPAAFATVSRLADYHLEERIGAGGMAVVFRARDERLQRWVALKVLAPALAGDEEFRQRFIRESQAAAAVDDPHIIPVFEAGEVDGVLFLAMRYVPGGDVRALVRRAGPLSPAHPLAIISPVASALDAAHSAGLVHRDVKLANILLDMHPGRPDHVYLSDFGLSKMVMSSLGPTRAGQFLGTPGYSAPEQLEGKHVDGRADQYSLACATFELLCGRTPFPRDQVAAVIWAHLSEPPPPLTSRRPGLPHAVDGVLAKALAKAPADRYSSCRAFAEALREALGLASYNSGSEVSPQADSTSAEADESDSSSAVQPNISAPAAIGEIIDGGSTPKAAKPDTVLETSVSLPEEQDKAGDVRASHPQRPLRQRPLLLATLLLQRRPVDLFWIQAATKGHRAKAVRRLHRGWPIVTTLLAVLLAAIIGGGYLGWRWSQDQYYVGADSHDQVVIYRGVNQRIAGFGLSKEYDQTGIMLSQVPVNYQQTLKATDTASNLADARNIVTTVSSAVNTCKEGYIALQSWVTEENKYQAEVSLAKKNKKPTNKITKPGPQPAGAGPTCPTPQAFGVAASAITPPAASATSATGHS
jgi:serine/threonine protein kinase